MTEALRPSLIALSSRAMGSGKSEAAAHLVSRYNFQLVKFAGPLKDMTRALLQWNGLSDTEPYIEGSLKETPIPRLAIAVRSQRASATLAMLRALFPHLGVPAREFDSWILAEHDRVFPGHRELRLQHLIDTLLRDWIERCVPARGDGSMTARHVMQTLGTEWGRNAIAPDFWTRIAFERSAFHLNGGQSVVIDDMRFRNELDTVRRLGGTAVRIVRPSAAVTGGAHASEGELDLVEMQEILNDGTITQLHQKIGALVVESR